MGAAELNLALAEVCAGTYESSAVPQWQDAVKTVHVHLSQVDGVHCVAWEGTTDFQEWMIDFLALEIPSFDHVALGPVHLGFLRDVLSVSDQIAAYFEKLGWPPYYNTGHSKGAAEALLFHGVMKASGHPPLATRAYEPPRVGSQIFRSYVGADDLACTITRNKQGLDLVCQVPFGPTWANNPDILLLNVPDGLDIPSKHRIPAVIEALKKEAA